MIRVAPVVVYSLKREHACYLMIAHPSYSCKRSRAIQSGAPGEPGLAEIGSPDYAVNKLDIVKMRSVHDCTAKINVNELNVDKLLI
jgi:hypothetical protein